MNHTHKQFLLALTLAVVVASYAEPSYAQIFSSAQNVGDAIASFLTGTFARVIGIIMFACFGIATAIGRIDWRWGVAIMVGLIAIFGGASIVAEVEGLAS